MLDAEGVAFFVRWLMFVFVPVYDWCLCVHERRRWNRDPTKRTHNSAGGSESCQRSYAHTYMVLNIAVCIPPGGSTTGMSHQCHVMGFLLSTWPPTPQSEPSGRLHRCFLLPVYTSWQTDIDSNNLGGSEMRSNKIIALFCMNSSMKSHRSWRNLNPRSYIIHAFAIRVLSQLRYETMPTVIRTCRSVDSKAEQVNVQCSHK